jgi:ornithine carbamoyltransferase
MASHLRHLLTLEEFSQKEILDLLAMAAVLKKSPAKYHKALAGQCLSMIFDKSSARTRVSFDVGMIQLGGHALFINGGELQIGKRESVSDTAKVLSRYVQGIMIRTYAHAMVEELAGHSTVPVINGLTDSHHPCQILADLQTMAERYKKLKGLQVVFVGDGNNVVHSLLIGCSKLGIHFKLVCPQGYEPEPKILSAAKSLGAKTGCRIEVTHEVKGSAKGADVVYTDVWASMGQEAEKEQRIRDFQGYQVNEKLMKECPKAIFLHCLPAHRGEEVAAGVIDGPQSKVWDQAENRLHAQKAVLLTLMGKRGKS